VWRVRPPGNFAFEKTFVGIPEPNNRIVLVHNIYILIYCMYACMSLCMYIVYVGIYLYVCMCVRACMCVCERRGRV